MSVLTRDDGEQLVLGCYRETLTWQEAKMLRREVRILSASQGEYVRLFVPREGQIDACFSPASGYLLAESVVRHFGRPMNLIFCEAVHEGQQFVLVIVRAGQVIIDTLVDTAQLADELRFLSDDPLAYHVHLSGKTPLVKEVARAPESILIDELAVRTWQQHENSVIQKMKLKQQLQLLPLSQAMAAADLHGITLPLMAVLTVMMALLVWLLSMPRAEDRALAQAAQNAAVEMTQVLKAPPAKLQLYEILDQVYQGHKIPGWEMTHLHYEPTGAQLDMRAYGGMASTLLRFAHRQHYLLTFTQTGVALQVAPHLPGRQMPLPRARVNQTIATLFDRMMTVMHAHTVSVDPTHHYPNFDATRLRLAISAVSPAQFSIIAEQLAGLPIKLQVADFNVNNGLLSGTLDLTVIGS